MHDISMFIDRLYAYHRIIVMTAPNALYYTVQPNLYRSRILFTKWLLTILDMGAPSV